MIKVNGHAPPPIPKRMEGEDVMTYVERLDHFRASLPDDLLHTRVLGVGTHEGIIPWYQADTIGGASRIPEGETILLEESNQRAARRPDRVWLPLAPKPPKRTPKQRMDAMVKLLWDGMVENYKATGQVKLPASVIRQMALATGRTTNEIELETLEGLRAGVVSYAAQLLNRAAKAS